MAREAIKDTLWETVVYLIRKKTVYFLIFIIIFVLATRADFSCGKKDGKWEFHMSVKNLDRKLMKK